MIRYTHTPPEISIHAPTRGATDFIVTEQDDNGFQSTLPQGERQSWKGGMPYEYIYFNPRSHKGSDLVLSDPSGTYKEFQSTLPQGERQRTNDSLEAVLKFQSTLPQGERRTGRVQRSITKIFQSTLPQGERLNPWPLRLTITKFQSTLPQGERRGASGIGRCAVEFQSTLPQGERPMDCIKCQQKKYISIHAPTRGATGGPRAKRCPSCAISIHAPTRGATQDNTAILRYVQFQSTLPQGERLLPLAPHDGTVISIHAPTRGATGPENRIDADFCISIHAPTRGATFFTQVE